MNSILKKIGDYKKLELESRQRQISFNDQKKMAFDREPARNFLSALSKPGINIIAEIKKASPSAGILREDFNPVTIAQIYEESGAATLSVLTDENFFKGHLDYLEQVHTAVKLPLLRKDFTIHEYNIIEARAHGADAILLIVAMLDDFQLKDFLALSTELGMSTLVEVHAQDELERALILKPQLIGINNRDLNSFVTDVQVTRDLMLSQSAQNFRIQNPSALFVSESGLSESHVLDDLHRLGANAFLIGEHFMKQKDIGKSFKELLINCET